MDKQWLLQLDALVQQAASLVKGSKRNNGASDIGDKIDAIVSYVDAALNFPEPMTDSADSKRHKPWRGNA